MWETSAGELLSDEVTESYENGAFICCHAFISTY